MHMLTPRPALVISLAAVMLSAIPLAGQAAPPSADPSKPVKLDNMPLSQLYTPGTNLISPEKEKSMYGEASVAYVKKYAREHQNSPELVAKMTDFFLPGDHNNHDPEAYAVFIGMIDVTIKKGKANDWTAFRLAVLIGSGFETELKTGHR